MNSGLPWHRSGSAFGLLVLAAGAAAQGYRVNPPLPPGGDVNAGYLTADGRYVFYFADQESEDVFEAFRLELPNGPALEISGPMIAGGAVYQLDLAPDSSRVLLQGDLETDNLVELYTVPVGLGPRTRLSTSLSAGVRDARFSPNSQYAVYLADQDTPGKLDLYGVPLAGGPSVRLNKGLAPSGLIARYAISPESARVVYFADEDEDEVFELYSVPIGGGTPTELNPPLVPGGDVGPFDGIHQFGNDDPFRISADSSRVCYLATQDDPDDVELYSVPIAGGPATKLNAPLPPSTDVEPSFELSPDSTRVVYLVGAGWTAPGSDLFSVPITGGASTQLSGPLVPGGDVSLFQITPDASRVVYTADEAVDGRFELFSVPLAGGASVRLHPPLLPGSSAKLVALAPDSSRAVYRASWVQSNRYALYSVPVTGGSSVQLTPLLVGNKGEYYPEGFTHDGSTLIALGEKVDEQLDLFAIPLAGGTDPDRLDAPLVPQGNVRRARIGAGFVVYVADQDQDEQYQLYLSFLERPFRRAR